MMFTSIPCGVMLAGGYGLFSILTFQGFPLTHHVDVRRALSRGRSDVAGDQVRGRCESRDGSRLACALRVECEPENILARSDADRLIEKKMPVRRSVEVRWTAVPI